MMFNKKMLGSCCVGLALLQSCDVFGAQRPLELGNETSAKPTTATEVKNAPQECAPPEIQDLIRKFLSQEYVLTEMTKFIEENQSPRKATPDKESAPQ